MRAQREPDLPPELALAVPLTLPNGEVSVRADLGEPACDARGTLILAHGAGAGRDHPFLVGFTTAMRSQGWRTVRFDFPYVTQGRRMPGPAAHAISTWQAVVDALSSEPGPLIAAGKSYGGRMASMAAATEQALAVDALVYLGYPFHPPGKPDRPRGEHLPRIVVPQLFVEGTNDPFIQPIEQFEQAVAACQRAQIVWIDGGGHSFEVKGNRREASDIGASLATIVSEFAAELAD